MNYKRYKEALKDKVQEQLGEGVDVYYTEMIKNNNVKKEVLVLRAKGEQTTTQMIHLDSLFKSYECTGNLEENTNAVLAIYNGRNNVLADWNVFEWEQVKPYVRILLVRMEGNEEYLKNRPYRKVLDMAMIFIILLKEDEEEIAAHVLWSQMTALGIDAEELYQTAVDNLEKEDFSITDMMFLFPEEVPIGIDIYIFSTKKRIRGARAMLRKDMLKAFADEKKCNIFILPSSIHEVMLICDDKEVCVDELKALVGSVNNDPDVIEAEEVLSDSVYYYDRRNGEVSII